MAETVDIQKVCRACLVNIGPFTDLTESNDCIPYIEMFVNCTSVNVSCIFITTPRLGLIWTRYKFVALRKSLQA